MRKAEIGYIYNDSTSTIKLPITSVDAVLDEEGHTVRELIEDIQPVSTTLVISTTAGLTLSSGTNKLSVQAIRNNIDITNDCDEIDFVWTRKEPEWLRNGEIGKTIAIGETDLENGKATFICTFTRRVSDVTIWDAIGSITIDGSFHDNVDLVGWIQSNLPTEIIDNRTELCRTWFLLLYCTRAATIQTSIPQGLHKGTGTAASQVKLHGPRLLREKTVK